MIRRPYRAGSFYPDDPGQCRAEADALIQAASAPGEMPPTVYGGLVPHAGWAFSGHTAAVTLKALAGRDRLKRIILIGADHWGTAGGGAVYDRGAWQSPLGQVPIDEEMAASLVESVAALRPDPEAHAREHSIEVQLPLVQALCAEAQIVPILVTPDAAAVATGTGIGEVLKASFPGAAVVGSTDLTHYGPSYGLTPAGVGAEGMKWARENDQRVLALIEAMRAEAVIEEAAARLNACGAGAIAATVAACSALGATRGDCLEYRGSDEVMRDLYGQQAQDRVGYAAVAFV